MRGIFLDIEANGLDPMQHRTIDIALKVIDFSERKVIGAYQSIVKLSEETWAKGDPKSLEINGYSWNQIIGGKEEKQIAEEITQLFSELKIERGRDVFICQNPSFDRAFFSQIVSVYDQEKYNWPYHWLDLASMFWAVILKDCKYFPERISVSKNEIGKRYNIPPETYPHHALNGVDHLIRCYCAVLDFHYD